MPDKQLSIAAEAKLEWSEIEAAEGAEKIPTFSMLAYTGGPMRVAGFTDPIIVDLTGGTIPDANPIFRGHDPDKVVGHGSAVVSESDIRVQGIVSANNDHAREVVGSGKNGFPWQASIGASVEQLEYVKRGETAIVNGKSRRGPLNIARKWTLNEVSVVPLGADRKTNTKVAARAVTLAELHHRRPDSSATLAELHSRRKS